MTQLEKLEKELRSMRARLDGHAELITLLYARLKAEAHHEPIPRIYLPILDTRPRPKRLFTVRGKRA